MKNTLILSFFTVLFFSLSISANNVFAVDVPFTLDDALFYATQPKIAIGSDGFPIVTYGDYGNRDLKAVHCTDVFCSTFDTPEIFTLDIVTYPPSIIIGSDGFPLIAYSDLTDNRKGTDLMVLHCTNASCSTFDPPTPLDGGSSVVGAYSSIAIGVDGLPIISYSGQISNGSGLKIVHCTNASCSTFDTPEILDVMGGTDGSASSIAIGVDGFPIITYAPLREELRVVHCNSTNCSTFDTPETFELTHRSSVLSQSIAIGVDGFPIILYRDVFSALQIIHCTDVLCSTFDVPQTIQGDFQAYASLAPYTVDGFAIIAYYDYGNNALKVIHCKTVNCSTFDTLKNLDFESSQAISSTSIAIGVDGFPIISYYDRIDNSLKALHIELNAIPDSDHDGLSDDDEILLGTDPNNPDTDGDALLDGWEVIGINGNGSFPSTSSESDFVLQNADPLHKDIFVEVDHMEFHEPNKNGMEYVTKAFANAPVENPDGENGITLHIQMEDPDVIEHAEYWNFIDDDEVANWPDYDASKKDHFGTPDERTGTPEETKARLDAKFQAYRYAVFIHRISYDGVHSPDTTGIGEIDLVNRRGGNDFVISLGSPYSDPVNGHYVGNADQQASTFMHELGHTLGLGHGGIDDENCKPNYLSLMNYRYGIYEISDYTPLDYSSESFTLDENDLDENMGIPSKANRVIYYTESDGTLGSDYTNKPIDWNGNGTIEDSVIMDINSILNKCPEHIELTELLGHNDWDNLDYDFKDTLHFAEANHPQTNIVDEITAKDYFELSQIINAISIPLKEQKLSIVDMLIELKERTDDKTDKKIDKVIKHIEKSADNKFWTEDGTSLVDKKSKKVFDEDKKIVKELMRILKKNNSEINDEISDIVTLLVEIDRKLAQNAIDELKIFTGDKKLDKEIEKAEKEMGKSQKELDKGKPDKVIQKYKKAWEHAQKMLKK